MKTKTLLLSFVLIFAVSCIGIRNPMFVNVPTAISNAIDGDPKTITDMAILTEADSLSNAYKLHGNDALLIRDGSNSLLGMIGAASFGIESKILAGLTMGVAGQQSVWDEKSRSITYLQGASYIDDAIGEYFYNVSEMETMPPDNKMSKPGAWLMRRLNAIKTVVNLSLIGLVPETKILTLAKGDVLFQDKTSSDNIDKILQKVTEMAETAETAETANTDTDKEK